MQVLQDELAQRWRHMFQSLAAGEDVAPSARLRAEGMMEAAILCDVAKVDLLSSMDVCYRESFGRAITDDFGADWQDFFPFPQIPAMGSRAPVYPSTKE